MNADVLHVAGDLDARHVISRQAQQVQKGSHLLSGKGAPKAAQGVNGDFYFRTDGGANTRIYFKSAGSWAGII